MPLQTLKDMAVIAVDNNIHGRFSCVLPQGDGVPRIVRSRPWLAKAGRGLREKTFKLDCPFLYLKYIRIRMRRYVAPEASLNARWST